MGFAPKTGEGLRIAGDFFGQKLERNEAVQASVLGLIDHTHTAAAKLFNYFVVGNAVADHSRNLTCCVRTSQRGKSEGRLPYTLRTSSSSLSSTPRCLRNSA